jgi:hypothetical protein
MAVRLPPVETPLGVPTKHIITYTLKCIANETDDVVNAFVQLEQDHRHVTDEFAAAYNALLGDDTLRLIIVPPPNADDIK